MDDTDDQPDYSHLRAGAAARARPGGGFSRPWTPRAQTGDGDNGEAPREADVGGDFRLAPPKTSLTGLPDAITFKLSRPVTSGEGDGELTHRTITLREPTAADLAKMIDLRVQGYFVGHDIAAVAICADLPERAVQQLAARDLWAAAAWLRPFRIGG